jgi:sulfur-oxidizing protein SoxZ
MDALEGTMTTPNPRVMVPAAVAKGEVFQVRAIISHQMETGLRVDAEGNVIPRKIINKFVCHYADVEVFSVELHEAVAANPFFEFYLHATESGPVTFAWEEDGGAVYSLSHDLLVG